MKVVVNSNGTYIDLSLEDLTSLIKAAEQAKGTQWEPYYTYWKRNRTGGDDNVEHSTYVRIQP